MAIYFRSRADAAQRLARELDRYRAWRCCWTWTPSTHDWVVIYAVQRRVRRTASTVVTETGDPFRGQRTVCGREPECAAYYRQLATGSAVVMSPVDAVAARPQTHSRTG